MSKIYEIISLEASAESAPIKANQGSDRRKNQKNRAFQGAYARESWEHEAGEKQNPQWKTTGSSKVTAQKTIAAYRETLKTHAKWASPLTTRIRDI